MSEAVAPDRPGAGQPMVLVVDDEPDLLELVSLTLGRMSLRTRTASDLSSARQRRVGGSGTEARGVRFRIEAPRPGGAAQARRERHAPGFHERAGQLYAARPKVAGQLASHGTAARDDRTRRPQPGTRTHLR